MRYALIALLLIAACWDSEVNVVPDEPNIDGVYNLRLQYLENTCDRDWWPQTWTDLYDVRLRVDGAYDLAPYRDKDSIWPLSFNNVVLGHGAVNHSEDWSSSTTLHNFTNTLKGHIDQASLDFMMTLNWENHDNVTPCHQTVHATGERWRVADPKAFEGMYLVMVSAFDNDDGYVCDNQLQQEVPRQHFQMIVSALENDDVKLDFYLGGTRLRLSIVESILLSSETQMWFSFVGWQDVKSKVVGEFTPGLVNIDLRMWDPNSSTYTCYYRYHIVGKRILPGERLTGEFRAVIVAQDQCTGTNPITRDDKYVVVEEDGGWVQMISRFGLTTWLYPAEDGSFSIALYEGGGTATYDGSITPSDLQFFYTFKSDGEPRYCGITRDVSAVARFIK